MRRVLTVNLLDGTEPFLIGQYAVPDPATWALMFTGFAVTGVESRRRRKRAIAA